MHAIDLADPDDPDEHPPYEIFAALANYHPVRTPVAVDDLDDQLPDDVLVIDGHVCLTNGDGGCSACGALIGMDAFGDGAPYFRILVRQLAKYGMTYCPDCLAEVQG